MNKIIKRVIVGFAAFALIEIALRVGGAVDFPLYHVDDGIGYVALPNQAGAFLRTNSWVFNDRSMGTQEAWQPKPNNLLLIGNSIVMGGNPFSQPQKLGPLLQGQLSDRITVWPIAVGGWTEVNETVYLERNADVASRAGFFVWVVLKGGLGNLSQWHGEYVWPQERPWCATWYVTRRYLLPHFFKMNTSELPPRSDPTVGSSERFEAMIATLSRATQRSTPGILVLYPVRAELAAARKGVEWLPERAVLEGIAAKYGVRVLDLSKRPEWTEAEYREGTHPTVHGNQVLAHIIAGATKDLYQPDIRSGTQSLIPELPPLQGTQGSAE